MELQRWDRLCEIATSGDHNEKTAFLGMWAQIHNEVVLEFLRLLMRRAVGTTAAKGLVDDAEDRACELRDKFMERYFAGSDFQKRALREAFRNRDAAIAYASASSRNHLADHFRLHANSRTQAFPIGFEMVSGEDVSGSVEAHECERVVREAAKLAIDSVWHESSERDRTIFTAVTKASGRQSDRYFAASNQLGVPVDTVRKRYFAIKKRWRTKVQSNLSSCGLAP